MVTKFISQKEWMDYGAHLKHLVRHGDEQVQMRLIRMWEDPNNRATQEIIFTENKISNELFDKIQKMIEEENP
jgi:hypothetical protein